MRKTTVKLLSALMAIQLGWAAGGMAADEAPAAPPPKPTESQLRAGGLLHGMATFLSEQKEFGVKMLIGFEVLQESGQKVEFGEVRELSLRRPGNLRMEQTSSDGASDLLVFDGKAITMYDADANVFATTAQTGGIDETIVHFVRGLGMRLPLAPMLMEGFPAELQKRVTSVDYVEWTDILGEPTHHIAGRTAEVDFEVWIEDGKKPLPLKIALSYRQAEGHPRFWAQFSDWDLDPDFRDSVFEFQAPKEAKSVPFAADVVRNAATPKADKAAAPAEGGAK